MTQEKQKEKFAAATILPIVAVLIIAAILVSPYIRDWQKKNNREDVEFVTAVLHLKDGKRDDFRKVVSTWTTNISAKDADVLASKLEQSAETEIDNAQRSDADKRDDLLQNRFCTLNKDVFFRVFELYRAAYKLRTQVKTENDLALLNDLNQIGLVCVLNGMEDFAFSLNGEFEKISKDHPDLLTLRKDMLTDFLLVRGLCYFSKQDFLKAEESLEEAGKYCIGTDISNDELNQALKDKNQKKTDFTHYPSLETQVFCLSKLIEICEKQNDSQKVIESQKRLIEMQSKAIREFREDEALSEYQAQRRME